MPFPSAAPSCGAALVIEGIGGGVERPAHIASRQGGRHADGMVVRALALLMLAVVAAAPLRAAEPLPPMAGISEARAKERAALFAELRAAPNEADAREIEAKLWTFWRSFADETSQSLLEVSQQAQLRFDYGTALVALEEVVKHQPQFAEGWNQLAYVRFLAGSYEASLEALETTLALEPLHYAALAGRGIILIQQGKEADAQAPLKRALAINPWLKERRLITDRERKI
jgi:tetratricopeptide (TPR) repeat protein